MAEFVVEQVGEFVQDADIGTLLAEFQVSLQFGWNERWACVLQAASESEALAMATSAMRDALSAPGPGRLFGANPA